MRVARVIVAAAVSREFDYAVPEALAASIAPGWRVRIPFGHRMTEGVVLELRAESERANLKPIDSLMGEAPVLSSAMLDLARWMAAYYVAPLHMVVQAMLPAPVRRKEQGFKRERFVRRVEGGCSPASSQVPGDEATDCKAACGQATHASIAAVEGVMASVAAERTKRLTPKQQAMLDRLPADGTPVQVTDFLRESGMTEAPLKVLLNKGLVAIEWVEVRRDPMFRRQILPTAPLTLMDQQTEALRRVVECCEQVWTQHGKGADEGAAEPSAPAIPHVVLLYGVTGSGKTEVYLQAIQHVLDKGFGALVMVPEIALTPQTMERFIGRFGQQVAVLHSRLSEGERHDEWYRMLRGEARIVVGARSAVFAPVQKLGLIVVDEEHEPSYKQEEMPRYNARDVAVVRGLKEHCTVLLGSATPALESWMNARSAKYRLAELPHRVDHQRMPLMRVIDMRVEAQQTGQGGLFSRELLAAIRLRLERAEQTILFLNRRGFATSLQCPKCGYVARCDHCSVSCTYHRTDNRLKCHICGVDRAVPAVCPGCGDPAYRFAGAGTQRIESVVEKCFPQAVVQRLDADVSRGKDAYDRILGEFRQGKTHILIGTQMIAKGLHFPNVTLVGVIHADTGLHMPDFRAGERTFQLLAQVAGRAGRGDVAGEVIVQTYTPFHPAIQAARRMDLQGFCDQELEFRRELQYPPFSHMVCLLFKGPSEERLQFFATAASDGLRKALGEGVTVSDPAPAPLARAKGLYRYHVMLRSVFPGRMAKAIVQLQRTLRFPDDVAMSVDVDPVSML